MAAVPQPRPGGRDVVGGALARRPSSAPAGPVKSRPSHAGNGSSSSSRSESGLHDDLDRRRVGGRRLEAGLAGVEALGRAARRPTGGSSCTVGAVGARRRGSCTKSTSSRPVSAIAVTVSGEPMNDSVAALPSLRAREVAVERRDDRVALALLDVVALPLPDARPARVGEHGGADRLEVVEQAVALDRGAHLLGARRDQQRRLHRAAPPPSPGGRRARRARCPRTTSSCTSRRARTRCRAGSPPRAPRRATSEIGRSRSGVCGPTRCGSSSSRSMSMTRS